MSISIIADVGSNFYASLDGAKKYIKAAAEIGVDFIKFQTWSADTLMAPTHPAYEVFKKEVYGLPLKWHGELIELAKSENVGFLTTPTQPEHVEFLENLGVTHYKVASGDLTFLPLLKTIAATGKTVILSTGMSYIHEVEDAISHFPSTTKVVLLHCVSMYPPAWDEMNLRALEELQKVARCRENTEIGLSDHSPGYTAVVAAVALGARWIEKHITLSRELKTPDASFALTVDEFGEMVEQARLTEKILGRPVKTPSLSEIPERFWARRGIYARRDLSAGSILTEEDIICLRPAKGIEAVHWGLLVGKRLKVDVKEREPIFWDMVS